MHTRGLVWLQFFYIVHLWIINLKFHSLNTHFREIHSCNALLSLSIGKIIKILKHLYWCIGCPGVKSGKVNKGKRRELRQHSVKTEKIFGAKQPKLCAKRPVTDFFSAVVHVVVLFCFFSPLALAAVSRPVFAPVQTKGLFFSFSKTSLAKQNIRRMTALLGNINIVAV